MFIGVNNNFRLERRKTLRSLYHGDMALFCADRKQIRSGHANHYV